MAAAMVASGCGAATVASGGEEEGGRGGGSTGAGAAAAAVAPDETAFDLLRALRSCRSTGLPCVDAHLPGGLGPSELLVLHGEAAAAKSALLQNIIAEHIAPVALGGHALPAVMIDADGAFDVGRLVALLEARAARWAARDDAPCGEQISEFAKEALSRLLVFCPEEPIDLLRQLRQLREVLGANPAASLIAVDAMTAWQPLCSAFSRAVPPVLRECWSALARLQRELCVSVVVVQRDLHVDNIAGNAAHASAEGSGTANTCHLSIMRRGPNPDGFAGDAFLVAPRMRGPEAAAPAAFAFTRMGEVVGVPC
mmetsp:Transcript_59152/g.183505  ORF Transcript_59152/g.183505 Transcript_59152/m.183505 type:complete len:311 (+) Transcript_59152:85-1017(+)